jgi:hypothetical protein
MGGGGRSPEGYGLGRNFPANREIYREFDILNTCWEGNSLEFLPIPEKCKNRNRELF